MPITHPQHEPDFCFIFNDKSFPISKCLFGLYSPVFRKHLISKETFEITEPFITTDAFYQFIHACQEKFYNITIDNCFELLFLCIKWQNSNIQEEILAFISTINDSLSVIKQLEFILKSTNSHEEKDPNFRLDETTGFNDQEAHFQSADVLIEIISTNLNSYLTIQEFSHLPIPILAKILHKSISYHNRYNQNINSSSQPDVHDEPSVSDNESSISYEHIPLKDSNKNKNRLVIDNHLLYEFLKSVFENYGPECRSLFEMIYEFGGFTEKELNDLIVLIDPSYVSPFDRLYTTTREQIAQIENMKNKLNELKTGSTKMVNKIEKKVNTIRNSLEFFSKTDLSSRDSSNSNLSGSSYQPRFSDYGSIVSQFNSEIDEIKRRMNETSSFYASIDETTNQINELVLYMRTKYPVLMQSMKPQPQEEINFPMEPTALILPPQNILPHASMILPNQPHRLSKHSIGKKVSIIHKNQDRHSNSLYQANEKGKKKNKNENPVSIESVFNDSEEIKCEFENPKDTFDGIFTFLRNSIPNCDNLHDINIVDIQASSSKGTFQPSILCKENPGWFWSSKEEPNQWVKFDFKNCRIRPDHYSIQTISNSLSTKHLKNWVLEGTNADGFTPSQVQENDPRIIWTELDRRENNYDLSTLNSIAVFEVHDNDQFYRYIRLRMIGPNHYGNHTLAMKKFELFGTLKLMNTECK